MKFKLTDEKRPTWESVEKPTVTVRCYGVRRYVATYDGSKGRDDWGSTFQAAVRAVTARMAQERAR